MNFLLAPFLLEILMLDAQNGAIIILRMQIVVNTLTSSAGYKQVINKHTDTVNNSFSCIDLIFCNSLNIISNYGIDRSMWGHPFSTYTKFSEKLTFITP